MEKISEGIQRRLSLLLVEDNLGDAHLVLDYLKGAEVPNRVTVLRDGMEAVDFLKRRGAYAIREARLPDLILLDLGLPILNGKEVLREIKEDPELSHIPVVILTGSQSDEERIQCYQSLANFYMVKPFDLSHFIAAMGFLEKVWLKPLLASSWSEKALSPA
ncbi:MAG TPA: response regulator [bacterium]|nr:response regulator [bacterium]